MEKASLAAAKNSKLSTQVRLNYLTEQIVNSGWTRLDCLKFCQEHWGVSSTQAQRYYYSAVHNLVPEDPDKYREGIIARNMNILESMLRKALEANNLKTADRIIRTINNMLGVGGKEIEIEDKNTNNIIKISFGD